MIKLKYIFAFVATLFIGSTTSVLAQELCEECLENVPQGQQCAVLQAVRQPGPDGRRLPDHGVLGCRGRTAGDGRSSAGWSPGLLELLPEYRHAREQGVRVRLPGVLQEEQPEIGLTELPKFCQFFPGPGVLTWTPGLRHD